MPSSDLELVMKVYILIAFFSALSAAWYVSHRVISGMERSFSAPGDYHVHLQNERGVLARLRSAAGVASRAESLLKMLARGDDAPVAITFLDGSEIRRTARGGVECIDSSGRRFIALSDNADLARLLDGAHRSGSFSSYGNIAWVSTIDEFLADNVRAYYGRFTGGNHRACNSRGGGRFKYERIRQVLASPSAPRLVDRTGQIRGFECFFSSMVHVYKSIGLIVPDYTREEIEDRYTHLFNDRQMGTFRRAPEDADYSIPGRHVYLMRGKMPSGKNTILEECLDIARGLRGTGWAKLTGMAEAEFRLVLGGDIDRARALVEHGYVAQVGLVEGFRWHYVAPVDIVKRENDTIVKVDDSWFVAKHMEYIPENFTDFRFIIAGDNSSAERLPSAGHEVKADVLPVRVSRDYIPFTNVYWLPRDSRSMNFNTHLLTDIAPLRHLKSLEILDLSNNPLEDIGPLARLTNMKNLNLRRTLVRDLSPLRDMEGLVVLNLRHTPVEDIDALPGSLKKIYLDDTIPAEAIARFKRNRPECELHFCDGHVDTNPRKGPLDIRWLVPGFVWRVGDEKPHQQDRELREELLPEQR